MNYIVSWTHIQSSKYEWKHIAGKKMSQQIPQKDV